MRELPRPFVNIRLSNKETLTSLTEKPSTQSDKHPLLKTIEHIDSLSGENTYSIGQTSACVLLE